MDCGAGDFGCEFLRDAREVWVQFTIWLYGIWLYLAGFIPFLDRAVSVIAAVVNWFFDLLGQHLQPLATLATTAFAILKWYQSRESALFKRLEKMLREQEIALAGARHDLAEVISRPGPGMRIAVPA